MSDIEANSAGGKQILGQVVSVTGSQAVVALTGPGVGDEAGDQKERFAVGSLIEIATDVSRAVGVVSAVTRPVRRRCSVSIAARCVRS